MWPGWTQESAGRHCNAQKFPVSWLENPVGQSQAVSREQTG